MSHRLCLAASAPHGMEQKYWPSPTDSAASRKADKSPVDRLLHLLSHLCGPHDDLSHAVKPSLCRSHINHPISILCQPPQKSFSHSLRCAAFREYCIRLASKTVHRSGLVQSAQPPDVFARKAEAKISNVLLSELSNAAAEEWGDGPEDGPQDCTAATSDGFRASSFSTIVLCREKIKVAMHQDRQPWIMISVVAFKPTNGGRMSACGREVESASLCIRVQLTWSVGPQAAGVVWIKGRSTAK